MNSEKKQISQERNPWEQLLYNMINEPTGKKTQEPRYLLTGLKIT